MSRLSGSLEKCTFTLIAQLVKNHLQCKRPWFDSWVRTIHWKGAGYPVFWPGEFHGLHSPWGCKELDTTEKVSLSLFKETIRPFPKWFSSVQFLSRVQLCDPMNCSTPGLPVHHQLPEPTQTHFHWVSDTIQLTHPLLSPSLPALNLSQHQGLFKWVSSSHQVAKVLEFQFQHQTFQWTPRTDLL